MYRSINVYIYSTLKLIPHTGFGRETLVSLWPHPWQPKTDIRPLRGHCGCPIWGTMGCPPSWTCASPLAVSLRAALQPRAWARRRWREGGLPETCCLPPDACHILVYTSISELFCGCFCSSVSYVYLILILLWGTYFSTRSFSLLSRWLWNFRFLFHWWWCLHGLDAILQIASSQFHL